MSAVRANFSHIIIGLLVLATAVPNLSAQITLTGGATLTVGPGASVTVLGGDIVVEEGATLVNHGTVTTDRNVDIAGTLQTEIRGETPGADYGLITAAGDVTISGTLSAKRAPTAYLDEDTALAIILHGGVQTGFFTNETLPGPAYSVRYDAQAVMLLVPGMTRPEEEVAKNTQSAQALVVYPNPLWGADLYVRGVPADREVAEARVYNSAGQRVDAGTFVDGHGRGIRLSWEAPPGFHVLMLIYGDGSTAEARFVVAR